MDSVFAALAHTSRRRMLDLIRATPGIAVGALAAEFDVTRIAVMNHLGVLSDAGLVTSRKEGRSRRLYLNAVPIQQIHARWLGSYEAYWADRVLSIKSAAEAAVTERKENDDDH